MSRNIVGHPHGDQVIKVAMNEVRALGIMPRDVEILGIISPPANACWIPESTNHMYLHIRSTISFDRTEGTPLTIETLFEFYDRYISIRRDWAAKLESDLNFYGQSGLVR
jgi:hypothetical protein